MAGYLPSSDADFMEWVRNFLAYAGSHQVALGLNEAELDALVAEKPLWENSYAAHLQAQLTAGGARVTKDNHREAVEEMIRPLVGRIQSYSGTTDLDRAELRITIRGAGVPPQGVDPLVDKPVPLIDINNRQVHAIRVRNQNGTTVSNARPSWAVGCEVWRKVGEVPVDVSDVQYVDTIKSGRYMIEYPGDDVGKSVYYQLRWIGAKGEKGPWSEIESATIAA